MHLVPVTRDGSAKQHSTCGCFVRVLKPGQRRSAADRLVGTERRDECDCRACLHECLPGSLGGGTDPDSINLEACR